MLNNKKKDGECRHGHVKTDVKAYGMVMKDDKENTIPGSFGFGTDNYTKLTKEMFASFTNVITRADLDDDAPHPTKTSMFADFIQSEGFKSLGIKMETPNEYVMLGMAFAMIIEMIQKRQKSKSNVLAQLLDL